MSSTVVIFNPHANRDGAGRLQNKLHGMFSSAGLVPEWLETAREGHGVELACQARQAGAEIVVAAGGDGTVNEVINGLAQAADTAADSGSAMSPAGALGILPIGSANDFATELRIPLDLQKAVQVVAQQRLRTIDLGKITLEADARRIERYFGNNVGFGLEASVTVESTKINRLRGILLYGTAAVRALLKYKPAHAEVRWRSAEGAEERHAGDTLLVSIGNSPRVGGGFYLTPDAQMDDGLLDIGIAQAISKWRTLTLLPKAIGGSHVHDPAFSLVRSPCVRITCSTGQPVHADGEVLSECAESIHVVLQPKRLTVLV